jgi:type IV pilus assembly protein PilE
MARFYTTNHRYDQNTGGTSVALPFTEAPKEGSTKHYDLSLVAADLGANTYTLQASTKGAQSGDDCGTLTLNQLGWRNRSGSAPMERCWR